MKVVSLALLLVFAASEQSGEAIATADRLGSDFGDFWIGIYKGMQKPVQPDLCVTQISQTATLFSAAYDNFVSTFLSVDPSYILATIVSLDNGFNSLVRAIELCQLKTLTYNIVNFANREGFGKALINLSVNMNQVLVRTTQTYWDYIKVDYRNSLYRNVGNSVGGLISIMLAYEF